jgi:hypothetical protein
VLVHHELLTQHKLSESHHLVQFWNEEKGHEQVEYVPRVVGCSVPHLNAGLLYIIFVLSHLKPFRVLDPLVPPGQTFETVFQSWSSTDSAKDRMRNCEATNESEDACDAERMKKKAQMTSESRALTTSLFAENASIPLVDDNIETSNSGKEDFIINQQILRLQQSRWFQIPLIQPTSPSSICLPKVTETLKQWKANLKTQAICTQNRRNKLDINTGVQLPDDVHPTESRHTPVAEEDTSRMCPETETSNEHVPHPTEDLDPEAVINRIGGEHLLNKGQWIAFQIIA